MLFFLQVSAPGITLSAEEFQLSLKYKGHPVSTETTHVASYGFVSPDCLQCLKMSALRMKMFLWLKCL